MRNVCFVTCMVFVLNTNQAFGAEGGMPQLNPDYWFSQIFWVILIFGILYVILWRKILPKINPMPTPAPANAIAASPAPIILAASNSIFPPFVNGVDLMHHLNRCMLKLQKHKLEEKQQVFQALSMQRKN